MDAERRARLREIGIVTLVSAAHFWSHFFTLAIPLALPLIREDLHASNVSLGLVMATYALMTVGLQLPMGVLADRYGARSLLIAGLAVESLAIVGQSFAPSVPVMIGIAVVMGIADSVFHPADYTILTGKMRQSWLGRAYAMHTFAGFLGTAVAPVAMTLLLAFGTWRQALVVVGAAGLLTAGLLLASGRLLSGISYPPPPRAEAAPATGMLSLVLAPPLLLMLVFYAFSSFATSGLQGFGNSALISLYEVDILAANSALAALLWGSAIGVLGGGLLADAAKRFDAVASVCYLLAAALLCLVGVSALAYFGMVAALFFTGLVIGAVMPARDLMVRSVAPPGATGRAFGYVSSGLGIGSVVGPLVYGKLMDLRAPQLMFYVSAGAMLAVVASALLASHAARRSGAIAVQAPV